MLAPKCPTFNGRPTFANPMYLKKAQNEHPGLYAITQDQSDPATRLIPDREEILTLAEESRSKLNKDLVKPFDYTKLNSLYEIFKPPAQHYEIQLEGRNCKSRQAYNVMTDNINHLKEIVDQAWVKHSNDHLHLRNPTAQDMEILIKICLMPLALKTQNDSFAFICNLQSDLDKITEYNAYIFIKSGNWPVCIKASEQTEISAQYRDVGLGEADSETSPKWSLQRKLFKTCCMNWGEVNPVHAYYNGSRTSKDNEDPSWNTSFKTRVTQKTTSALEDFI
ncbi:hypothetical protein Tco_1187281 [Tanacetum coccineum]